MTIFDNQNTEIAGSAIGNPYGYTGRRWDAYTGLWYRNRMYSPTLGRFMQKDPAGFVDGLNLYAYVMNNPVRFTDPDGLMVRDFSDNFIEPGINWLSNSIIEPGINWLSNSTIEPGINWLSDSVLKPATYGTVNTGIQVSRTFEEEYHLGADLFSGNFSEAASHYKNTVGLALGIGANFLSGDVWDEPQFSTSFQFKENHQVVYTNGMSTNPTGLQLTKDTFTDLGKNDVITVTNNSHYDGIGDAVQAFMTTMGIKDITSIRAETLAEKAHTEGVTLDWYAHSQGVKTAHSGFTLAKPDSLSSISFVGMGGQTSIFENEFSLNSVENYRVHDGYFRADLIPLSQYLDPMYYIRSSMYGSGHEINYIPSSVGRSANAPGLSLPRHDVQNYLLSPGVVK